MNPNSQDPSEELQNQTPPSEPVAPVSQDVPPLSPSNDDQPPARPTETEPVAAPSVPLSSSTPLPPVGRDISAATPPVERTPGADAKNKLAAYALCISFGVFGIHDFYLGNKKAGLFKISLLPVLLLGSILFAVMRVNGGLIFLFGAVMVVMILVAYVWWIIDIFRMYLRKDVDADGNPLAQTPRDRLFAKGLFIYAMIGMFAPIVVLFFGASTMTSYNQIQQRAESVEERQEKARTESYNDLRQEGVNNESLFPSSTSPQNGT